MTRVVEGAFQGGGRRFAIVAGRFNEAVVRRLVDGCLDGLRRHGVADDAITLVWVPGSFEIPAVARRLAANGGADAVICLGAVIRGSTPHFDHIAAAAARGIAQAAYDTGVPVIFGVLTCDTIEQALERSGSKAGNKGFDAAMSALEMAGVMKALDEGGR